MSAAMLVLVITAFVPVMGLEIPSWVTWHWIAGIVLILSIVYHIIHAIGWQDFWSMMSFGPQFFREGFAHLRSTSSRRRRRSRRRPASIRSTTACTITR
jgi:hypothetical protein